MQKIVRKRPRVWADRAFVLSDGGKELQDMVISAQGRYFPWVSRSRKREQALEGGCCSAGLGLRAVPGTSHWGWSVADELLVCTDVVGQLALLERCSGWIQALQEGQAGMEKRKQWQRMELCLGTVERQLRACGSGLEGTSTCGRCCGCLLLTVRLWRIRQGCLQTTGGSLVFTDPDPLGGL